MRVQPEIPTRRGTTDKFTGAVFVDTVVESVPASPVRANKVHFTPGARSHWHSHALGQYLHVLEGVAIVVERGADSTELRPGDTVFTEPGVWHWHGSAGDTLMTHLAIWEAPRDGEESSWGEAVTDEEYRSALNRARR
ncbi:MAG: cupin domain-containing protein [Actinomycetota bacterium]|nr:cupin domain-containing protein [Actinomycetota bacterium]